MDHNSWETFGQDWSASSEVRLAQNDASLALKSNVVLNFIFSKINPVFIIKLLSDASNRIRLETMQFLTPFTNKALGKKGAKQTRCKRHRVHCKIKIVTKQEISRNNTTEIHSICKKMEKAYQIMREIQFI